MRTGRQKTMLWALALSAVALLTMGAGSARAALSYKVPAEWAGIWASTDSVYNCPPVTFDHVTTSEDTLCAGQDVMYGMDTSGMGFTFDCTGTVTPTSIDVTCIGSGEVVAGCTMTMSMHIQGTRSGDTSVTIVTQEISYSGSAPGCNLFPGSCTRTVSRATRTGAAPSAYCATPALPQTWGSLKARYR